MANKLTIKKLQEVIDIHIEEERNFLFVVDYDHANLICDILGEDYDIVDEDSDLHRNKDLYYVSMWFDEDGGRFYCETAKGCNSFKEVDTFGDDFVDYFIQEGTMSEQEADRYLLGEGTWSWFEIVEDNEDLDICNCQDCQEQRFFDLLADTMNRIIEAEGCPNCIMDALMEYSLEYQKNGFMIGRNR